MVKYVTSQELEELIQGDKPVVCDFWATWCGPCRMLAPVFEDVSDKLEDKAVFVKLDVDENEDAAVKYGITSIPNIILFKKGQPAANHLGFIPEETLKDFIEKNLCCLFMEHNYFPALFNINFIDETSFEEFHHFYFRMVGIYAGKIQTDVFLSET